MHILKLCFSEYLDLIPPWKKMKEAFSVKFQNENLYFCLRQELKPRLPRWRIWYTYQEHSECRSLSKKWKKKSSFINNWKNIIAYWRIWARRGVCKQVWFVPNTVGWSGRSGNPTEVFHFSPSFKLGNSISST